MKTLFVLLALFLSTGVTSTYAQINLKRKLERKADQEIDKLLFKKKKKGQDYDSADYTIPANGSSSDNYESGNTGNYKPKEVDFSSVDGAELIHFTVLIDLLPEEVDGFVRSEEPDGSIYKSANFNVSTGSKEYAKDGNELSLSVFDYKEAAMLYTGQASQFYEYESTDGYAKSIELHGGNGWVSKDYDDESVTLFLGIKDRYIFTADLEVGEDSDIIAIAEKISLDKLP